MLTCEAVVQMRGWQASRGARLETSVAILVGMPIIAFNIAINLLQHELRNEFKGRGYAF